MPPDRFMPLVLVRLARVPVVPTTVIVLDAADHDPLEVRVYDSPSFKVVPIAAPGEIAVREPKARDAYVKRLRSLAAVMGL